eukprot:4024340-Prymnesium_polylepis.1
MAVHASAAAHQPRLHAALLRNGGADGANGAVGLRDEQLPFETLYSLLAHGSGMSNEVAPLLSLHLEPAPPMRTCSEGTDETVLRTLVA